MIDLHSNNIHVSILLLATQGGMTAMDFVPTREAGMTSLDAFLPRAGKKYASTRNYDYGPDARYNVSGLSPYISRRLVFEGEVLKHVLKTHSSSAAEKFIQEVVWRTYWKGWLELRPSVWLAYLSEVDRWKRAFDEDQGLTVSYHEAVEGRTGIDCFDAWVEELVETGYLHNHTRMWFASIWIFTLNLPWALGADFFYRHLLDGDPASNTLSWRWVAGLHTKGKTYTASASNINRYTNGRFNPAGQLARQTYALDEDQEFAKQAYDPGTFDVPGSGNDGLLIFQEDLTPEISQLGRHSFSQAAIWSVDVVAKQFGLSNLIQGFSKAATEDCRQRVQNHFGVEVDSVADVSDIMEWCRQHRLQRVVCLKPCQGPWRDKEDHLNRVLTEEGLDFVQIRRAWDRELHPHAKSGYFAFKKQIPSLLSKLDSLI